MNEDKLIQLVVQNTEDIRDIKATMVTKDDLNKAVKTLDRLVALAEKKDKVSIHDQKINRLATTTGIQFSS